VLKTVEGLISKNAMQNVLLVSREKFEKSGRPFKFYQTQTGLYYQWWIRQLTGDPKHQPKSMSIIPKNIDEDVNMIIAIGEYSFHDSDLPQFLPEHMGPLVEKAHHSHIII
jgi:hypothetical protein